MKQAKQDADEIVKGYKGEKQEEFNSLVLSAGASKFGLL